MTEEYTKADLEEPEWLIDRSRSFFALIEDRLGKINAVAQYRLSPDTFILETEAEVRGNIVPYFYVIDPTGIFAYFNNPQSMNAAINEFNNNLGCFKKVKPPFRELHYALTNPEFWKHRTRSVIVSSPKHSTVKPFDCVNIFEVDMEKCTINILSDGLKYTKSIDLNVLQNFAAGKFNTPFLYQMGNTYKLSPETQPKQEVPMNSQHHVNKTVGTAALEAKKSEALPPVAKVTEEEKNQIFRLLKDRNLDCHLFGGAVRDLLRGEKPKDYDVIAPLGEFLTHCLSQGWKLDGIDPMEGVAKYGDTDCKINQYRIKFNTSVGLLIFELMDTKVSNESLRSIFNRMDYDVNCLVMHSGFVPWEVCPISFGFGPLSFDVVQNLVEKKMNPIKPSEKRQLKMKMKGWTVR